MAMVESLLVIFSIFHMKDGVCLCRFVWMCFFFLFRKGFVFKLKLAFCWNDVKKKKKSNSNDVGGALWISRLTRVILKYALSFEKLKVRIKTGGSIGWINRWRKKKASSGKRFMNKLSLSSIHSSRKQGKFIWKKKKMMPR